MRAKEIVVGATYLMRPNEKLVIGFVPDVLVVKIKSVYIGAPTTVRVWRREVGSDIWSFESTVLASEIRMRIGDVE